MASVRYTIDCEQAVGVVLKIQVFLGKITFYLFIVRACSESQQEFIMNREYRTPIGPSRRLSGK